MARNSRTNRRRKSHNAYTTDQVAKAKRLFLDADFQLELSPGEVERITAESGVERDMLYAILHGRAHKGVEPALPTEQ